MFSMALVGFSEKYLRQTNPCSLGPDLACLPYTTLHTTELAFHAFCGYTFSDHKTI